MGTYKFNGQTYQQPGVYVGNLTQPSSALTPIRGQTTYISILDGQSWYEPVIEGSSVVYNASGWDDLPERFPTTAKEIAALLTEEPQPHGVV